jgi:hypothetical protein
MRFILDSGRVGDKRLISIANFLELITPQIRAPMEQYPALELSKPTFFSYGLGWFVQDYRGHEVVMHTGSINGMSALIGLLPQDHVGVYVLANTDHMELRHALMYQSFDLFIGGAKRDWSAELAKQHAPTAPVRPAATVTQAGIPTPPKAVRPLDRYAGVFLDSAYGTVTVNLANDTLSARWEKLELGALDPAGPDLFRSRPTPAGGRGTPVAFIADESGSVTSVRAFGVTFMRVRRAP